MAWWQGRRCSEQSRPIWRHPGSADLATVQPQSRATGDRDDNVRRDTMRGVTESSPPSEPAGRGSGTFRPSKWRVARLFAPMLFVPGIALVVWWPLPAAVGVSAIALCVGGFVGLVAFGGVLRVLVGSPAVVV